MVHGALFLEKIVHNWLVRGGGTSAIKTRINLLMPRPCWGLLWLPLDFLFIEKTLHCINSGKCTWLTRREFV